MDHETAHNIACEAISIDIESRDSFVQSSCGDDKELLGSVRKILDSLCPTEIGQSPQLQDGELSDHQPRKIAHFTIRRVIGTGGMGTVYEGVQDNPRRKVAIKVMRTGVTSRSAQRRFEFESQVLARLHHQCIAQIYEAGTWDDGSGGVPWFAMEYIAGARTLIDYANEKSLGTRERLTIFNKVCDAINHGHGRRQSP